MQKLDAISFNRFISSPTPVIVKFGAEWCPPCKALSPLLAQIQDVPIGEIDTDRSPEVSGYYRVTSLPTLIKFQSGKELSRHIGGHASVPAIRRAMGI